MNGTAAREFSSVHAPSRDAVVREFTQLSPARLELPLFNRGVRVRAVTDEARFGELTGWDSLRRPKAGSSSTRVTRPGSRMTSSERAACSSRPTRSSPTSASGSKERTPYSGGPFHCDSDPFTGLASRRRSWR